MWGGCGFPRVILPSSAVMWEQPIESPGAQRGWASYPQPHLGRLELRSATWSRVATAKHCLSQRSTHLCQMRHFLCSGLTSAFAQGNTPPCRDLSKFHPPHGSWKLVSVRLGCVTKHHRLRLQPQTFVFSRLCRLEVQGQGARKIGFWGELSSRLVDSCLFIVSSDDLSSVCPKRVLVSRLSIKTPALWYHGLPLDLI